MKKSTNHSGTELFLMEMILSVFFLAVSFAICIGLFASATADRREAQELNHMQELTLTVGEILEGSDGTAAEVLKFLPGGIGKENALVYYFDKEWKVCEEGVSSYIMSLKLKNPEESGKKGAQISFEDRAGELLYETEISYPVFKGVRR